jgi:hypothetical protein
MQTLSNSDEGISGRRYGDERRDLRKEEMKEWADEGPSSF